MNAAIFDVDGLLIDSEPIWRRTEVEVFATVGVALTEEMCVETTGPRIDEVAAHWLMGHQTIAMTMRYAHLMPGATRAAVRLCVSKQDETEVHGNRRRLAGRENLNHLARLQCPCAVARVVDPVSSSIIPGFL